VKSDWTYRRCIAPATGWGGERTALINQLRAILLERGTVIAQERRNLERELDAMLGEEEGLAVSQRLRMLIEDMREEWRALDSRITAFDDEFAARAKNDEGARRLATILISIADMLPSANQRHAASSHVRDGLGIPQESDSRAVGVS
jgi:hypothetical protein